MDSRLLFGKPRFPFAVPASGTGSRQISFGARFDRGLLIVFAGNSCRTAFKCEFGGFNAPLEPRTPAGRFLSGSLLDDRNNFPSAARARLELLAAERDEADARMRLSIGSDEAHLHRRIAEMKRVECWSSVQDIMYMLVLHKFHEIGVHLVPKLSQCIYNGRLEIWPYKEWELESIHSLEVLEMVREHLRIVLGWQHSFSRVITNIQQIRLCRVYAASIIYGYFLKSASLRHDLEYNINLSNFEHSYGACSCKPVSGAVSLKPKCIAFECMSRPSSTSVDISFGLGMKPKNLRCYVMGFDEEMIQMCGKPKSREAVNLMERYSCALFGLEKSGVLETDVIISTSFASLKRFVLEAVAFGSFLWEAESCVDGVYKLEEN